MNATCTCNNALFTAGATGTNPFCPVHGDPRDTSIANPPDPDTLTLVFTVKVDREGMDLHKREFASHSAQTPAEVLIAEAKAAWESEGLVIEAEGRRTG